MENKKNNSLKAGKIGSVLLAALLILVSFSAINVQTTSVTNNNAPAAYKKQSDTYVLVMNFTVTSGSDVFLNGTLPSIGAILVDSGESSDWNELSFIDATNGDGDWNASVDSIWIDTANANGRYDEGFETLLAGVEPDDQAEDDGTGARDVQWTGIKTIDGSDGDSWNSSADAIVFDADDNGVYMDKLTAVTFKLNSSCNATHADISDLTLWNETTGAGFSITEDTFIANASYSASSSSWNISGLSIPINIVQTFYVAVNISGSAVHWHDIILEIPTLNDQNSNGAYNNGDQGLFLAGTNDTGDIVNANGILIDNYAPVTEVDSITPYWNTTGTVQITVTANDNLSGVDSVTLYYYNSSDNSSWSGPWTVGTDSSSPYSWNFDFTAKNDSGWYRFYSLGTDEVDNVETFIVNDTECAYDGTGPTVAITIPADGSYNSTVAPVNWINGTCNDIESGDTKSGVNTVNITIYNSSSGYYWDGGSWSSGKTWLNADLAGSPYSTWSYDSSSVSWDNATSYIINATGTDNATNVGSEVSNTIYYDTYAPTTTIDIPEDNKWYNALTQITGAASDAYSGIQTVNITIYNATSGKYWNFSVSPGWADGVNWTPATGYDSWTFNANSVSWENGSYYYVNATATDNASNIDPVGASSYFIYDTEKPYSSVDAISPYWYTIAVTPKTIFYTADDNGSGLKNVTLYYRYSDDNVTWDPDWTIWVNSSNPDSYPCAGSWDFNFPNNSGYYEFYTRAADNATNIEEAPSNNDTIIGYDIVDPTAEITLPEDNAFYKAGDAIATNITGTATDPQSISVVNLTIYNSTDGTYFTGSGWGAQTSLTANMSGSGATIDWWYDNASARPNWATNKTYVINVSAKDTAGNWNLTAATATFTYDATNPMAPVITMPEDTKWYNALTNITGTATDDGGSEIEYVNITIYNQTGGNYWTGSAWGANTSLAASLIGTGWTKTWYYSSTEPTYENDTTYLVNASATDHAGNVGPQTSHTFTFDDNGLNSSVTAISPYWNTTGAQILSYTAADAGSGLYNVTLYYRYRADNGSSWGSWTIWNDGTNPDTIPWNPSDWTFTFPSAGHYQFHTIAIDNASNAEVKTTAEAECGYDDAIPTVTISMPEDGEYYTAMDEISGTCDDTLSGIKEVNITIYNVSSGEYWHGGAWAAGVNWLSTTLSDGNSNWSYASNGVTWDDEEYIVNATATDNATLTSTKASRTFYIDTTAPTVAIAFGNSDTYYSDADTVIIYANFTETGSGINQATVVITVKNSTGSTIASGATGTDNTHWYYSWNVPAGNDGNVNVSVTAADNVSYSLTGVTWNTSRYIDNTAPTVTVEYNNTATYFKQGDKVKIYANFTETGSGINESSVYVNMWVGAGVVVSGGSLNGTDNTHYTYNYTIPSGDGTWQVSVWGTDNVSLDGHFDNTTKKVDNTGSTAEITTIGAYVSALTQIEGNASDGTGVGVNKTEIKIYNTTDNTNWTGTTWTDADNWDDATGYNTWTYDTSTITWVDGNVYTVYAKSTDNLSNVGSTVNDSFIFDEGDPLVTSVTITDTTISSSTYVKDGDSVNVTIIYSDATLDSSSASSLFKADLSDLGGSSSASATGHNDTHAWWVITASSSGNGPVTVTINVTDDFGNYNNTESDTIIADNAVPTINYTVLDADNDGSTYTYIDIYFSESTMDNSTFSAGDFTIVSNCSSVTVSSVQSSTSSMVTLKLSDLLPTGDRPMVSITGSVTDLAGNAIVLNSNSTIFTYRISLSTGWNLISIPGYANNVAIATFLSSISSNVDTVYEYDSSVPDWYAWSPGGAANSLTSMKAGLGYWIKMDSADVLTGNYNLSYGEPPSIPTQTLTGPGWNLIGHYKTYNQTSNTAGALASLNSVLSATGEILYMYTSTGGFTNIYDNANYNMEPTKGYWLWISDTTTNAGYTAN